MVQRWVFDKVMRKLNTFVSKVSCMWKEFFKEHIALDHADLVCLQNCSSLEAQNVDAKEAEVLMRIVQLMRRLKPMGDDELRSVWLPVKSRRLYWLQVTSSEYQGCHFLKLRLQNAYHMLLYYSPNKTDRTADMPYNTEMLLRLLTHLADCLALVVEGIEKDAAGYNAYVEDKLDPACRTGVIAKANLEPYCSLCHLEGIDKEKGLALLESPPAPYVFKEMTLRVYRKMRRIAHEAVFGEQKGDDADVLNCSPGVREMASYDLDSPDDFKKWEADRRIFHGLDVIYARVHLAPKLVDNGVELSLWTASVPFIEPFLKAALGLTAAGYPPRLEWASTVKRILSNDCGVRITPYPTHYMGAGDTPVECSMPGKSELGTKRFNELARLVEWDPIQAVLPSNG